VIYVLGVSLLVLAYRIYKSSGEEQDPEKNFVIRTVQRVLPVSTKEKGGKLLIRENGKRLATPLLVCLVAIVFADIAFAIDSIPAAFGITRDSFSIWMGNVFALLGLRALFVLVEGLARKFRYLDETIAAVLAIVGVKLLIEDIVLIGPVASLGIIFAAFAIGIGLSIAADKRDAQAKKKTSPSTA
jgi:tellurite resistance protein TerC